MESESTQCTISSESIIMNLSVWLYFSYFTSNNYENEENHDDHYVLLTINEMAAM